MNVVKLQCKKEKNVDDDTWCQSCQQKEKRRRRRRICVFVVAYRVLSKRNYFKCLMKVEIVKYMKTILKDI